MALDQLGAAAVAAFSAIPQAAWPAVITLVIATLLVGIGGTIAFSAREHRIKDQRVAFAEQQTADYNARLSGSSFDEGIKQVIEALKAEVTDIRERQPWSLSTEQVSKIKALALSSPTGIKIIRNVGSGLLETMQMQVVAAFQEAGWAVHFWPTLGAPKTPHQPVTLSVPNGADPSAVATIRKALTAAGIPFGEEVSDDTEPLPIIWLSTPVQTSR
jgi:hypothetical protein